MKNAFRSALIITIFTFSGQLILFASQILVAAFFGASTDMDAFLAASALPQYLISVLLGSLGFVFVPFFIDYRSKGNEQQAYELARSLLNNCILFLGIITVFGIIFAKPLLELIAPGLSPEALETAVKVAIITWPTILASGPLSLLLSIYQAERQFAWQAAVPVLGAITHLILLIVLAPSLGIIGLAIATLAGIVLQAILLIKIVTKRGKYKFSLNWNERTVQDVFRLLAPLVLVAFATKFTPLIDRYLASGLQTGSISHLNYAFRLTTTISILISVGGSTVIFPKMATDFSNSDLQALRKTISFGLRIMWLIIAPVIAIGISVALPGIVVLFERGRFNPSDSIVVADLFRIYSIALIAMCLGSITGKGFYVLRDTRTLAIFGTLESIAYIIYTIYLTRWLGVIGIPIGYVIFFNLSLAWQLLILNFKTGSKSVLPIVLSFGRTTLAALIAGGLSYLISSSFSASLYQLIAGCIAGFLIYLLTLVMLRSSELKIIWKDVLHLPVS
jgi:putative peptidoglycan lipid II flippase